MVRWESELIPILTGSRGKVARCSETAVELSSGYGIADLVFYELNEAIVNDRIAKRLSPIEKANLIRLLVELRRFKSDETFSITLLRKKTPTLSKELITYLVENEFLIPIDENEQTFIKGNDYQNGIKEIVAIEAKLKDWKRGLYQAYRYRGYADKSYLAVYTKSISSPLAHIDEFKKYNVGLIEVADDGIVVHYKPKKERRSDDYMKAIAYENLLAIKKNSAPSLDEVARLVSV